MQGGNVDAASTALTTLMAASTVLPVLMDSKQVHSLKQFS